ncbi:hypothetical protein XENOCAPTIV_009761 [Xenoophorus captivus]|uniref:Uncharacterized protein n=1 Tax=Xenoophorus captivus TaxID=1517983 RepID=A0ABV0S812_9TELE
MQLIEFYQTDILQQHCHNVRTQRTLFQDPEEHKLFYALLKVNINKGCQVECILMCNTKFTLTPFLSRKLENKFTVTPQGCYNTDSILDPWCMPGKKTKH